MYFDKVIKIIFVNIKRDLMPDVYLCSYVKKKKKNYRLNYYIERTKYSDLTKTVGTNKRKL